jgi:hypothetical protein
MYAMRMNDSLRLVVTRMPPQRPLPGVLRDKVVGSVSLLHNVFVSHFPRSLLAIHANTHHVDHDTNQTLVTPHTDHYRAYRSSNRQQRIKLCSAQVSRACIVNQVYIRNTAQSSDLHTQFL